MLEFPKLLRLPALLLGVSFSSAAFSIDLVQSYNLAVENSADLAAARITSQADGMSEQIALAEIYPTLTLDASSRKINKYFGPDRTLTSGSATITQTLWSESLRSWLDSAEEQGALSSLQYQKAQMALSRQVVDAYFGVLAAQDALDTSQREIASITTLRDHAVVRRDTGIGTESEVRTAEARLALANAAVIMSENEVDSAILALSELLGERPAELNVLDENVTLPQLVPRLLQDWLDIALSNNTDILIQQALVTLASHSISLSSAESDFRVRLSARINDKFSGSDSVNDHTSAMLSISKSFSAAGLAAKQKKQAALRYEAELQKLQGLKSRTITLTSSTYRNVISLIDQIEALKLAVSANESALEITQSNYEVGLVTSLPVLDAQQDVFEVRRDLLKARYNYFQNLIALEQIAGTLDITDLEVLNRLLR